MMDSLKRAFSSSTEEEQQEESILPRLKGLSWKQKVIGFLVCAALAAGFAILGCVLAYVGGNFGYAAFAILFTLGTLSGVSSTFFLVSPIKQLKQFWNTGNWMATIIKLSCTIIFVLMIALSFCAIFWWDQPGLAILFCIIEFVALVIYSITLIPFATTVISRGARGAWSTL